MTYMRGCLSVWVPTEIILMRRTKLWVLLAALGCFLLAAGSTSAQSAQSNLTVTYPAGFAVSPPLSQISQPALPTVQTIIPLRPRPLAGGGALAPSLPDQALQTAVGWPLELEDEGGAPRFPGVSANGSAPPDPNLAVGPNHIVQIVNTEFAVYSKSEDHRLSVQRSRRRLRGRIRRPHRAIRQSGRPLAD